MKFSYLGMIYNFSMTVGASMIGKFMDLLGRKGTLLLGAFL